MNLGSRLSSLARATWKRRGASAWLLLPLASIYCTVIRLRRAAYRAGWLKTEKLPTPVIVVGNITVGGSGKTPLVIALVNTLKARGYRPGVVSRGYGGSARNWPRVVHADSDPADVGDEPVLINRRTNCPVIVGPDRIRAAGQLLVDFSCNIVVSDDGLQHHRLSRDVEILVVDGIYRFGNGFCLPAGPLRESKTRIYSVDMIVCNGGSPQDHEYGMRLSSQSFTKVGDFSTLADAKRFTEKKVHAVAGIGRPERFFHDLQRLGVAAYEHAFSDHHSFVAADFKFSDDLPVLMTEKDAVKCRSFADSRMWFLPVGAELGDDFYQRLIELLEKCDDRQKIA